LNRRPGWRPLMYFPLRLSGSMNSMSSLYETEVVELAPGWVMDTGVEGSLSPSAGRTALVCQEQVMVPVLSVDILTEWYDNQKSTAYNERFVIR